MPDITMCEGTDCPFKDTCYRHTAQPTSNYQSYFVDVPYDTEKDECDYHWKVSQSTSSSSPSS